MLTNNCSSDFHCGDLPLKPGLYFLAIESHICDKFLPIAIPPSCSTSVSQSLMDSDCTKNNKLIVYYHCSGCNPQQNFVVSIIITPFYR